MKSFHFNGSDETIELILRTIISVNQLSVYSAVADMRGEFSRYSKRYGKSGAIGSLESRVITTECLTADPIAQTYAGVQGNLLREDEQKFADLLEQDKLTKLSSNAGFSQRILRKDNSSLHLMMIHLTN